MQRLSSIAIVIIAVAVLVGVGYMLGQRHNADGLAVRAVLADMTVHANNLERQQIETRNGLASLVADLHKLKSDEVNGVLKKYGL